MRNVNLMDLELRLKTYRANYKYRLSLSYTNVHQKKKERYIFHNNTRKISIGRLELYSANFHSAFCTFNIEALDTDKCRQRTFLLRAESFEGFASARLAPFIEASPTFYSPFNHVRRRAIFLGKKI